MKRGESVMHYRAALADWQAPKQFRETVALCHAAVSSVDFFNRPALSFLRDAWVIAEYLSERVDVARVRLSTEDERWPDGFIEVGGHVKGLEVTEALETGRRRGDEFKNDSQRMTMDPVEEWVRRAELIPAALEEAIIRKRSKQYAEQPILLVYLNISEWGIRHQQLTEKILEIKHRHLDAFSDLCVLWKDKWL